MSRRGGSSLAIGLLLAIAAPTAAADPSKPRAPATASVDAGPEARERVLALYREGKALVESGKIEEGCRRFEEAKRIDGGAINLLIRLADCYERLGRTATAVRQLKEVALIAAASDDARAEEAEARARALEPRQARLTIVLRRPAPDVTLRCNGRAVPEAEMGRAVAVDPGGFVIEASAPGRRSWKLTREIAGGEATVVEVPELEAAGDARDRADVVERAGPSAHGSHGSLGPRRIASVAVGAAGLVGLGIGAGFGVAAIARRDASNAGGHCDRQSLCDDAGYALRLDARRAGNVSTAAFLSGAAALGGGLVLWFTAPARDLGLRVGPGPGSLWIRGAF